ncbi:MAG: L-seryl-tRNA(Sec) selenium transferase [Gammaproteobacteria bacterium]|jgi:L-seryl-tRNA(Ser) seleniumtransferase|nr:L-seryl-tRNA(Sec) selenium transferase [Gammaproteobacteria bacterium]
MNKKAPNLYNHLPSVDQLLKQLTTEIKEYGHEQVVSIIRSELVLVRELIRSGAFESLSPPDLESIVSATQQKLESNNQSSLTPVFNLTGTVLHTNLGRALLPKQAIQSLLVAAASPSNLEFDLNTGQRGERDSHFEELICELTGAEAATAVNNNAAAVLLCLNSLALGKQVPVSRGELVEIGGSFRIPEVMERAGTQMIEIGTTNRTHLKDYKKAITDETAAFMKVHTSNYHIEGFTNEVSTQEITLLAQQHNLPFIYDMGSGSLVDFSQLGLPAEATVAEVIAEGVDIVTFSGDKLLGGPQCGIIAGKREWVEKIRQNPLKRALRIDKLTLAALSEVLKLYRNPEKLMDSLPTLQSLTRSQANINKQAKRLLALIKPVIPKLYDVSIIETTSQIGSGALPVERISSTAFAINSINQSDNEIRSLALALRKLPKPVIGRIQNGKIILDLRCLETDSSVEAEFIEQLSLLQESA